MIVAAQELSRILRIDQIPNRGTDVTIEASDAERRALADRFGLVEISALTASVKLKALANGTIVRMSGTLRASVVQTCVVTLEPVPADIAEEFAVSFRADLEEESGELDLSIDDEDPPEPIIDGAIDVGEVVAEHLALALDPFPRKPGAAYIEAQDAPKEPGTRANPFAVLAAFREKKV